MSENKKRIGVGDRVRVIGPSICGDRTHGGETFTVGAITISDHIPHNPYDGLYYPLSSLERVVEEGPRKTEPLGSPRAEKDLSVTVPHMKYE